MRIDTDFLQKILIKIAEKSDVNQRHSAAIIKNGKIIDMGFNKYCSFAKKSTIHAEMDVLSNLKKKYKNTSSFNGLDIIIIRIGNCNNSFVLKNSRPCNQCIDYLKKYNIKKVYYSNEYGDIVCEKLYDMEKKHVSSGEKYFKKLRDCQVEM